MSGLHRQQVVAGWQCSSGREGCSTENGLVIKGKSHIVGVHLPELVLTRFSSSFGAKGWAIRNTCCHAHISDCQHLHSKAKALSRVNAMHQLHRGHLKF